MRKLELIGAVVIVASIAAVAVAAYAAEFGFGIKTDVAASDTGLPQYPGAWKHHDDKDKGSDSAAKIWGSFGAFGMKIAVVQLDTNDQPAKVAAFYREALRKSGPVLDCSAGVSHPPKAAANSKALDCSDDHPQSGSFVYKTGLKDNFHVVGVEPRGTGASIALVAIQVRGH